MDVLDVHRLKEGEVDLGVSIAGLDARRVRAASGRH